MMEERLGIMPRNTEFLKDQMYIEKVKFKKKLIILEMVEAVTFYVENKDGGRPKKT